VEGKKLCGKEVPVHLVHREKIKGEKKKRGTWVRPFLKGGGKKKKETLLRKREKKRAPFLPIQEEARSFLDKGGEKRFKKGGASMEKRKLRTRKSRPYPEGRIERNHQRKRRGRTPLLLNRGKEKKKKKKKTVLSIQQGKELSLKKGKAHHQPLEKRESASISLTERENQGRENSLIMEKRGKKKKIHLSHEKGGGGGKSVWGKGKGGGGLLLFRKGERCPLLNSSFQREKGTRKKKKKEGENGPFFPLSSEKKKGGKSKSEGKKIFLEKRGKEVVVFFRMKKGEKRSSRSAGRKEKATRKGGEKGKETSLPVLGGRGEGGPFPSLLEGEGKKKDVEKKERRTRLLL